MKCVFYLSAISVGFELNLFPILNSNFFSFYVALPISLLISPHMPIVLSVMSIKYLSFSRFIVSHNTFLYIILIIFYID